MSNPVPEKLINFRVYRDGADLLGIADAELPSLEAMTDTVKGAGIAGEIDSPVLGHYQSMGLTLNWRTVTGDLAVLAGQKAHSLDLRGANQVYDAAAGEYRPVPVKVTVRAVPKNVNLGKLDVGTPAEAATEFEVVYLKLWVDGQERIEIDKYNYICKIAGTDHMAGIRAALGLA